MIEAAAKEQANPIGIAFSWKDVFWAVALAVLGAGQLLQGVDPLFTGLILASAVFWLLAVRFCGGPTTLTGAAIGYVGLQHIAVSQYAKLLFWQRPDTPLFDPIKTGAIYAICFGGICLACWLLTQKPFSQIRSALPNDLPADRLKVLAIVCTALMIVRYLGSPQLGVGGIRFLMNFEFISPMAAAATAAYTVTESQGRKFLNWLGCIVISVPFTVAILGFQRREAVFAIVVMLAVSFAYGFRFRPRHFIWGVVLVYFFQFIFFPFALYYRSNIKRTSDLGVNLVRAWEALTEVASNPLKYQDEKLYRPTVEDWYTQRMMYYDLRPNPTLDRLSLIIVTDALVRATDQLGPTGWGTIMAGVDMVVPRVFNEDKELLGTSNPIAQRAPGLVSEVDRGTQITMGFFAEAYQCFKWTGVILIPFLTTLVSFFALRITVGNELKNNLWAGSFIVGFPWMFSEGTLQQVIISIGQNLPLSCLFAWLMIIAANSLARRPDKYYENVPEPQVFEDKSLRVA